MYLRLLHAAKYIYINIESLSVSQRSPNRARSGAGDRFVLGRSLNF